MLPVLSLIGPADIVTEVVVEYLVADVLGVEGSAVEPSYVVAILTDYSPDRVVLKTGEIPVRVDAEGRIFAATCPTWPAPSDARRQVSHATLPNGGRVLDCPQ